MDMIDNIVVFPIGSFPGGGGVLVKGMGHLPLTKQR